MDYDTIIIGGGPGGLAAAYTLADEQRVLVIENHWWGGTCPNFGCDPKKMLYSAVEARDWSARMTGNGLVGIPDISWPRLMAFKRSYTSGIPGGTKTGLNQAGIVTVDGKAQLVDAHTVTVDGQNYTADHIVIATGQTPTMPDIPGVGLLGTSTDFLDLDQLPRTMAFIGGSYVALELANIAATAGAEVHLIVHSDRLLRAFPESAVKTLIGQLKQKRIQIHENVSLTEVKAVGDQVKLIADDFELTVYRAFAAMGRSAVTDLNLDAVGVAYDHKGIHVDNHLKTSVDSIYAIGDVIAKTQPKLTPVSSFEGRYVAQHILGQTDPIQYPVIPTIVFSATKVAQVGVSLDEAKQDVTRYQVVTNNTTPWYTYNRIKDPIAQTTTIVDKTTGHLVGAVVVSTLADEMINAFTGIINQKLSSDAVNRQIYAYPTPISDLSYYY
ncbi:dihydrolipoyl dehydrogenase family protein [Lacticaseibacillus saniviri]|uniref:Glutathione reductase n=1 Tax=Lacticaseibacillus saniviri JCM 17471 = DSM 24301 TaxID=1293598 RepID=A0A0R2N339_9LACO|nr:NAD(P)/FAD-dependent oxidoreductase [Lacticaseibacillus saniviri]KRO18891.1 glutathione reductase [Lacticaseibacillus saniviri JCM 17471 = DSM 24301]MCG4281215.1 NAD(P)/FAD-dependent oxidoreductase [Lacticaseibacillus saniviri]